MKLSVSIPDRVLGILRLKVSYSLIRRELLVSIPDRVLGILRQSNHFVCFITERFQSLIGF